MANTQFEVDLKFRNTNIGPVVNDAKRQLEGIEGTVKLKVDRGAVSQLGALNGRLQTLNKILEETTVKGNIAAASIERLSSAFNAGLRDSAALARNTGAVVKSMQDVRNGTTEASNAFESFGRSVQLSAKRFTAFTIGAGALIGFTRALETGVRGAVDFQNQMVKLAQVAEEPTSALKGIQAEITKLSTTLGVSSTDLAKTAVTLKQAGLSLKDVNTSLEAIAEASLAPNFKDMNQIVEGSISIFSQFGTKAEDLKGVLGSLNAVAGSFAVEASDLVTLITKTGGSFKAAGGDLNELLALFTSVRATTRESADSIATGFRTIFGRLQKPETIEDLKQLGIELRFTRDEAEQLGNTNLTGQFVGAFEAVRRLSTALRDIPTTDTRFAQVVESVGGLRQISKVIPLIQQFSTSNKALAVALSGTESLARSTGLAQESLTVKVTKLQEAFSQLFRSIADSQGFRSFVDQVVTLGTVLAKALDILKPLVPLIISFGAAKIAGNIGDLVRGARLFGSPPSASAQAQVPIKRASGGFVPGSGNGDSVHAMLEPGEFVLRKSATQSLQKQGVDLQGLNKGGSAQRFIRGGKAIGLAPGISLGQISLTPENSAKKPQGVGAVDLFGGAAAPLRADLAKQFPGVNEGALKSAANGILVEAPVNAYSLSSKDKQVVQDKIVGKALNGIKSDLNKNALPPKVVDQLNFDPLKTSMEGYVLEGLISAKTRTTFFGDDEPFDFRPNSEEAHRFQNLFEIDPINDTHIDAKRSQQKPNNIVNKALTAKLFSAGAPVNKDVIDRIKKNLKNEAQPHAFGGLIQKFAAGGLAKSKFLSSIGGLLRDKLQDVPSDLVSEIPADSELLGLGTEAAAFRGANGNVFRLGFKGSEKERGLFRPNVPEVLQPLRSKEVGNFTFEELPFAPSLNTLGIDEVTAQKVTTAIGRRILKKGFLPTDINANNIGVDTTGKRGNKVKLIDPSTFTVPKTPEEIELFEALKKKHGIFNTTISGPSSKKWFGGPIHRFANGGASTDTVPALLTPGEFVINKKSADRIGPAALNDLNQGKVAGFARGGHVGAKRFAGGGGADESNGVGFPPGGDRLRGQFERIVNQQIAALRENTVALQQTGKALITPANPNTPLSVLDSNEIKLQPEIQGPFTKTPLGRRSTTLPPIPIEQGIALQDFGRNNDFANGPTESEKQERLAKILAASEKRAGKPIPPIKPPLESDFSGVVLKGSTTEVANQLKALGKSNVIPGMATSVEKLRKEADASWKKLTSISVNVGTGEVTGSFSRLEGIKDRVGSALSAGRSALSSGFSAVTAPFRDLDENEVGISAEESKRRQDKNAKRNQLSNKLLLGAGLATTAVDQLDQRFVGKASANSGTGFSVAKGVTGAVSQAATGAALGSVGGAPGIVVGATIFGLMGLADSLKQASKDINDAKIDESLNKLNEKLINFEFKSGSNDFKDALSNIQETKKEIDNRVALDETVGTKEFFDARQKKTKETLGPSAAGLTQNLLKNAEEIGASFKSLDAAGNSEKEQRKAISDEIARANPQFKELTQEVSNLSGQSFAKLNKSFVDAALIAAKNSQRQKSQAVVDARIGSISQFADAMTSASRNVDVFANKIDAIGSIIDGNFNSISTKSLAGDIGTFGLPGNKRFAEGTDTLLQPFGKLADPFKDQLKQFDKLAAVLPQAIVEGASKFSEAGDTGDVIKTAIKNILGPDQTQGESFKSALNLLGSQFSEIFKLDNLKNKLATGDVSGISKEALKFTEQLKGPLLDLARTMDEENTRIASVLSSYRQTQEKIVAAQDRTAEITLESDKVSAEIRASRTGQKATDILGVRSSFNDRQSRLLEGTGLGNNNVAGIGEALRNKNKEILALDEKRQKDPNNIDLTKKFATLQTESSNLSKALNNLADVSSRSAAIQARLSDLQQRREARGAIAERLVTGSPEDKFNLIRGLSDAGTFKQLDDKGRQDFVDTLDPERLKNLLSAAESVRSENGGGNLKNEILNSKLQLPKGFLLPGKEEKNLQDQLIEINKAAVDASIQLTNTLKENSLAQKTAIDKFIAALLTDRENRILGLAKDAKQGQLAPLVQRRTELENVKNSFGDLDKGQLKKLKEDKNIIRLNEISDLTAKTQQSFDLAKSKVNPGFVETDEIKLGRKTGIISQLDLTKLQQELTSNFDANFANEFINHLKTVKFTTSDPGSKGQRVGVTDKFDIAAGIANRDEITKNRQSERTGIVNQELKAFISAQAQKNADQLETKKRTLARDLLGDTPTQLAAKNAAKNPALSEAEIAKAAQAAQKEINDFANKLDITNEGINSLKNLDLSTLNNGPLSTNIAGLTTQIDALKLSVDLLTNQIAGGQANNIVNALVKKPLEAIGFAKGGSIFQPRGTDTVPAMLTPGEFVVNARATAQHGGLLEQINAGRFANGGIVKYLARGRKVDRLDLEGDNANVFQGPEFGPEGFGRGILGGGFKVNPQAGFDKPGNPLALIAGGLGADNLPVNVADPIPNRARADVRTLLPRDRQAEAAIEFASLRKQTLANLQLQQSVSANQGFGISRDSNLGGQLALKQKSLGDRLNNARIRKSQPQKQAFRFAKGGVVYAQDGFNPFEDKDKIVEAARFQDSIDAGFKRQLPDEFATQREEVLNSKQKRLAKIAEAATEEELNQLRFSDKNDSLKLAAQEELIKRNNAKLKPNIILGGGVPTTTRVATVKNLAGGINQEPPEITGGVSRGITGFENPLFTQQQQKVGFHTDFNRVLAGNNDILLDDGNLPQGHFAVSGAAFGDKDFGANSNVTNEPGNQLFRSRENPIPAGVRQNTNDIVSTPSGRVITVGGAASEQQKANVQRAGNFFRKGPRIPQAKLDESLARTTALADTSIKGFGINPTQDIIGAAPVPTDIGIKDPEQISNVGVLNFGGRRLAPKLTPQKPLSAARLASLRETEQKAALVREERARRIASGKSALGFADGGSVPAMVSPGESYTGNAQIGAAVNSNRVAYLATGGGIGVAQAAQKSTANSGVAVGDFSKLQQIFTGFASSSQALIDSMTTFNASSQQLAEAMKAFPRTVTLEGRHTVEVIINGADAFNKMKPEMADLVAGAVQGGIRNLVKNKFPDAGTVGLEGFA